jgi:hypothetical protein
LVEACCSDGRCWSLLPEKLRDDAEFRKRICVAWVATAWSSELFCLDFPPTKAVRNNAKFRKDLLFVWARILDAPFSLLRKYDMRVRFILQDRTIMLKACSVDGRCWRLLSAELRADMQFRKDVLHAWTAIARRPRGSFDDPEYDRLRFAPNFVKDDKQAMMVACQRRSSAYRFCSKTLQLDEEIIRVAFPTKGDTWLENVRQGIIEHGELPLILQDDRVFICDAVRRRGVTIYFSLEEPLQKELDITIAALSHLYHEDEDDYDPYDTADTILQNADPLILSNTDVWLCIADICYFAYLLFFEYATPSIFQDRTIMLKACSSDGRFWGHLSAEFRDDEHFRRELRQAWMEIAKNDGDAYDDPDFSPMRHAPGFIKDDKAIMMQTCQSRGWDYEWCSERLQFDLDIIEAAMEEGSAHVVTTLPHDYLLGNTDLILRHFRLERPGINLHEIFPREIWSSYEMVQSYLANGGIPHELIPSEMWKDPNICLACLKSAAVSYQVDLNPWQWIQLRSESFYKLAVQEGVAFAAEKFYTGCGQRTPLIFWKDFSLQLELVSNLSLSALPTSLHGTFCSQAAEELLRHATFSETILRAICVHKPQPAPATRCKLTMLDQGTDIRSVIADYAGVPRGRHLRHLRDLVSSNEFREYRKRHYEATRKALKDSRDRRPTPGIPTFASL